jgi:transposase
MKQFTPQLKHHILTQYRSHSSDASFVALARRYAVNGGESTIRKWHQMWNGTVASLQRKAVSGRPRKLSRGQVQRHVQRRIVTANKRSQAVHYPSMLPAIKAATRTDISLRTLQRYGQEEGTKEKRSKKRTAAESKCTTKYN